jgi:hypothetical protein
MKKSGLAKVWTWVSQMTHPALYQLLHELMLWRVHSLVELSWAKPLTDSLLPAHDHVVEHEELVDVEQDPGEVADQEEDDDAEEDGGLGSML